MKIFQVVIEEKDVLYPLNMNISITDLSDGKSTLIERIIYKKMKNYIKEQADIIRQDINELLKEGDK